MKKTVFVFLVIAIFLSSCQTVPVTQVASHPTAPTQDITVMNAKTVQTKEPTVTIIPQPVPMPPLSSVEKYALMVMAFQAYFQNDLSDVTSDAVVMEKAEKFYKSSLVYGDKTEKVGDILSGFSGDDWDNIKKAGEELANGGGPAAAIIIHTRGCKFNCSAAFSALWWACAHLASGVDWIKIPEGIPYHPDPVLCGKPFNWERLVDILDENCAGIVEVSYVGSTIIIKKLGRKPGSDIYEFRPSPEALPITVAIITTAVVVGIIVVTGGSGTPIMVPILLSAI